MKFIASSLIAGACIGIAAMTYLHIGGLIGSIMFAFGLMAVVWHDLKLFTGKAQFAWGKQDKRMPRYSYSYGQIVTMLGLNIVGCWLVSLLVGGMTFEISPDTIVANRISDGVLMNGLRAIPCGFIMTLSVKSFKKGVAWPLIFGIPTFIVCAFPHCIADVFYYATCNTDLLLNNIWMLLSIYAVTVIGNYLGCNLYRSFTKFKHN